MKYFKKLIGEKIYLSPINIEDVEKYTYWFSDFKTTDGMGNSSRVDSIETTKEWFEKNTKNHNYVFSIVKLDTDELLGYCKFFDINNINRTCVIGILIGEEKDRNKGYGKETIGLMLDYAFNYLNINNVMLQVKSFNERAISCYKNIGFKEIGRRRKSYFLNGKYYDEIYMDILAEEFNKEYIKNKNI
ncbi:MAG: GNAT family N-acetyltransferase [Clostridiales bacterium]|nr:GNAT family N-acetyltransferase [Clostridiales bacterium]